MDLVVTTPPQGPHHSVGRKRLSVGSPLDLADLATRPHLRPQWTWLGARWGRACGRGSRVPVLTGSPGHRVAQRREASVVSGAAGAGARATFAASAG